MFSAPKTCNDNNACTTDTCDPVTGNCVFTAPKLCSDNNACTTDSCDTVTGNCVFSAPKVCNDNDPCTSDHCNPANGNCVFTPGALNCNDNNICTSDQCTPGVGCTHQDISGTCNDNDPCTDDTCDPQLGCQHTPNDNPACLGLKHFQCYEIKPFAFPPRTVSVQDQFADASMTIHAANRLCAPSDKAGEDPTAPADARHLAGFPSSGGPRRILNQTITNQFGTVQLDLVRRTFLLVPTAKNPLGVTIPPLGPNSGLDHFQCYLVRRSSGAPRFTKVVGLPAVDQFGSHAMDLLRPRYFCAPANKAGENPGAQNHTQSLLCYKARHRLGFPTLQPFIANQFVSTDVTLTRRMEFCVPSTIGAD